MNSTELAKIVDAAWERRTEIGLQTKGPIRKAVAEAIALLDQGGARVAERQGDGNWHVNQWLKKAVLLSFRLEDTALIKGGPGRAAWWDKVPSKFDGWTKAHFKKAGFRAVPGAIVRRGAYIAPNVVLMPSFVNLGAYVGEATMIDTWATVGSCAQIGRGVHLSGGVGIGGVLEPVGARPVIIEDGAFIGSDSQLIAPVRVGAGAYVAAGSSITNDVPAGALGIARGRQHNVEGWAERKKQV